MLGARLPYDRWRNRAAMFRRIPIWRASARSRRMRPPRTRSLASTPGKAAFVAAIDDFYLTNPIARVRRHGRLLGDRGTASHADGGGVARDGKSGRATSGR
jgi:hypothetical protein